MRIADALLHLAMRHSADWPKFERDTGIDHASLHRWRAGKQTLSLLNADRLMIFFGLEIVNTEHLNQLRAAAERPLQAELPQKKRKPLVASGKNAGRVASPAARRAHKTAMGLGRKRKSAAVAGHDQGEPSEGKAGEA